MKHFVKPILGLVLGVLLFPPVLMPSVAAQTAAGESASESIVCPDSELMSGEMISDICWECMFPIRVAGVTISGKKNADTRPKGSTKKRMCMCRDKRGFPHPGVVLSFWQPAFVFEFERTPGCLSSLNGTRLPFHLTNRGITGHDNSEGVDGLPGFRHYHMYAFPIMIMLDMFLAKRCNPGGYRDFDLLYLSEIDPTWSHDELAFFVNFENALVASPLAVTACIADAVAANTGHPIDLLWWCAGSWGHVYPLSGHVNGFDGIVLQSSRMNAKAITLMHRRGILKSSMGDGSLCKAQIAPIVPKSQYRFSMFFPRPETDDTHGFGESTLLWGMNRTIPSVGEDPAYIVWRWVDCCYWM